LKKTLLNRPVGWILLGIVILLIGLTVSAFLVWRLPITRLTMSVIRSADNLQSGIVEGQVSVYALGEDSPWCVVENGGIRLQGQYDAEGFSGTADLMNRDAAQLRVLMQIDSDTMLLQMDGSDHTVGIDLEQAQWELPQASAGIRTWLSAFQLARLVQPYIVLQPQTQIESPLLDTQTCTPLYLYMADEQIADFAGYLGKIAASQTSISRMMQQFAEVLAQSTGLSQQEAYDLLIGETAIETPYSLACTVYPNARGQICKLDVCVRLLPDETRAATIELQGSLYPNVQQTQLEQPAFRLDIQQAQTVTLQEPMDWAGALFGTTGKAMEQLVPYLSSIRPEACYGMDPNAPLLLRLVYVLGGMPKQLFTAEQIDTMIHLVGQDAALAQPEMMQQAQALLSSITPEQGRFLLLLFVSMQDMEENPWMAYLFFRLGGTYPAWEEQIDLQWEISDAPTRFRLLPGMYLNIADMMQRVNDMSLSVQRVNTQQENWGIFALNYRSEEMFAWKHYGSDDYSATQFENMPALLRKRSSGQEEWMPIPTDYAPYLELAEEILAQDVVLLIPFLEQMGDALSPFITPTEDGLHVCGTRQQIQESLAQVIHAHGENRMVRQMLHRLIDGLAEALVESGADSMLGYDRQYMQRGFAEDWKAQLQIILETGQWPEPINPRSKLEASDYSIDIVLAWDAGIWTETVSGSIVLAVPTVEAEICRISLQLDSSRSGAAEMPEVPQLEMEQGIMMDDMSVFDAVRILLPLMQQINRILLMLHG